MLAVLNRAVACKQAKESIHIARGFAVVNALYFISFHKNFKPMTKGNDSGELIENRDKDSLIKFMTEYVSDIEIQRMDWPNLQPLR